MSKRVVHYYPWDGGTEANSDMPDEVLCRVSGDLTEDQLSTSWGPVTGKRCLSILSKHDESPSHDE